MDAYTLDIDTERSYQVRIGTFLLENVGVLTRDTCGGARAVIVTDSNVGPLYEQPVRAGLEEAGYTVDTFTFPAGEASKTIATWAGIVEFVAERELTRTDVVVALGGGVTGDMAGFAAAAYMRGVPFVQIPTSLLAMVDSSVGGKTAVDLSAGKNLVGAFWQPSLVVADIGCLGTLSDEQLADGCGEVVKHAMIADAELFGELERTPLTRELLESDLARTASIVARNIGIKRAVVAADEREGGVRKLLNFGHSFGHAVEAVSDYQMGHGACVAAGMNLIASASAARGWCDGALVDRLRTLLRACGLPTTCPFGHGELMDAVLHDKKRSGASIDLVIPVCIGSCSITRTPLTEVSSLLKEGLALQKTPGGELERIAAKKGAEL